MERLDKLLANTGRWSRREARELVRQGRVTVDGAAAAAPEEKYEAGACVAVDGELISVELLPEHLRRMGLFPVGRLDKDTEGLLLLTNDGPLAHRLLSPRRHVDKTYFVRADRPFDGADEAAFAAGMVLRDGLHCLPARLERLDCPEEALVTIQEGKYHQIKRMVASQYKQVV